MARPPRRRPTNILNHDAGFGFVTTPVRPHTAAISYRNNINNIISALERVGGCSVDSSELSIAKRKENPGPPDFESQLYESERATKNFYWEARFGLRWNAGS